MTVYNTVEVYKKKPKELHLVQVVAKSLIRRCTSCFTDLSVLGYVPLFFRAFPALHKTLRITSQGDLVLHCFQNPPRNCETGSYTE